MTTNQPYVPYNGTAGWSGTDTSQERAMINLRTGKEYNNQQKTLALIKASKKLGFTWKELSDYTGMHHGTASGVLSVLHKSGAILRTTKIRNKCKVYMDLSFADTVKHEPYVEKAKKSCPNCGHTL
jgi:hypothetical protein